MAAIDKRKMERFSLEIPTYLQVAVEQESESRELVTRDVCAGGALFHTDQPLPVGTEIKVDLVLSISELKKIKADKVLIKVDGVVIRTDEKGMAVCFDKKYKITPLKS
jgi:hypothetical protein